jgi:hypothetical protein
MRLIERAQRRFIAELNLQEIARAKDRCEALTLGVKACGACPSVE